MITGIGTPNSQSKSPLPIAVLLSLKGNDTIGAVFLASNARRVGRIRAGHLTRPKTSSRQKERTIKASRLPMLPAFTLLRSEAAAPVDLQLPEPRLCVDGELLRPICAGGGTAEGEMHCLTTFQLQENKMKKYLFGAGIVCAMAAPALADDVGVRVGPVGAGATVGKSHEYRDRDRDRTTVIKEHEPESKTVIKKEDDARQSRENRHSSRSRLIQKSSEQLELFLFVHSALCLRG